MMERNKSIDIIRALCALEIIAFWHLCDYTVKPLNDEWNYIGSILTMISLGCFSYISGFCLQKYQFRRFEDVTQFYKKRVIRIYPLFFVSALSLYVAGFITSSSWFHDSSQFVLTIFGLTPLVPPTVGTLWYISMAIFFYLITPILKWGGYQRYGYLFCTLLYLLLIGVHVVTQKAFVDEKLLFYYPAYVFGLYSNQNLSRRMVIISSVLFAVMIIGLNINSSLLKIAPFTALLICSVIPALRWSSSLIESNGKIVRIATLISYSSMAAYLFHRHIYTIAQLVIGNGEKRFVTLCSGVILVMFVFSISYFIQKCYDLLSNRVNI